MHLVNQFALLLFILLLCPLASAHAAETTPAPPVFMPERLDYRPYLADPRSPRFSASLLKGTGGLLQDEIAFGGAFALLNLNSPTRSIEALQLAVSAGVWSRFDLRHTLDMVGADYRAGVSLSEGHGPWRSRLQYVHESDHRGDEFIIRTGMATRTAYRREEIGAGISYSPNVALQLYAEVGYAFSLGILNRPWRTQAGLEWEDAPRLRFGAAWYAAADLQSRQEMGWNLNGTIQAGVVKWNMRHTRATRLFVEYHAGHETLGEFFREKLNYASVGLAFYF